jgi:hypothetical protein
MDVILLALKSVRLRVGLLAWDASYSSVPVSPRARFGQRKGRVSQVRGSHPSQKARRMGHPALWNGQDFKNQGCATRPEERSGFAGSWFPPFAKSAKDGAPSFVEWSRFQKLRVRHPPRGKIGFRRFVVPTLRKKREGWGTQLCGMVKISKIKGAPPAG